MLTSMGDIMREAHKRGWITTRDGNISIRRGDGFYVTPSGVRKPVIIPEMIVKGKFIDGALFIDEGTKPSGELLMHEMLQTTKDFPGIRAVVHLHPTYTIAAMLKGFELGVLAQMFPEVSRYTRVGFNVPVTPVTSIELAGKTHAAMTCQHKIIYDIVGQEGHGVCSIGNSPWDAFEHIERLEHICQIVLASGVDPKDLIV